MAENLLFNIEKGQASISISLCSSMENIDRASSETKKFLDDNGFSGVAFDVCLVLREGLSNAVRHAHRSDPHKVIKYILTIMEEELMIEIEDEGEGFDWQAAMSHMGSMEQGSLLEHGRGFKIMNQYFSEFRYNKKGNKLFLKKHVSK
ncbi:MAG: ATP-binding protein [Proteobacteria bacterium]|nr:ATP-binding protein [Pseudomonadota bacterium]